MSDGVRSTIRVVLFVVPLFLAPTFLMGFFGVGTELPGVLPTIWLLAVVVLAYIVFPRWRWLKPPERARMDN